MDVTNTDLLPDDDQDTGLDDDAGDGGDDGQGEDDPVAALQQQVAALEARNTKLDRELQSGIGRLQSMMTKLESGRGDTEALKRQMDAQLDAVTGTVQALLEDEAISPEVRARAQQVAKEAKSASEFAVLKAELESLKRGGERPRDGGTNTGMSDFEADVEAEIKGHGLDPDDSIFDWRGEASRIYREQGPGATRAYFRKQIATAKASREVDTRRQSRKESAGKGSPGSEGTNARILDPSKSREERIKILRDAGAI